MKKIFLTLFVFFPSFLFAVDYGVQDAWDNPEANMSSGSIKPGYAQLTWTPGSVIPIKLRNGMVTMINLPAGEQIVDGMVGSDGMFDFTKQSNGREMYVTPKPDNQGSDTNLIVTGRSGNKYIFYLRSEPANSSEITYSQVDIIVDGNVNLPSSKNTQGFGMASAFRKNNSSSVVGVDGEDYGWIKSVKIDPSEFRFDLDIFVPNPDDYIIAPERVWRDRIFTYIDFGDKVIAMTQRPVVSLLVEGGETPVGFRTDGEDSRLLIVEAVGDMVLRSGQRLVCIKKREKPFLIADTASVMALAESNVQQSMLSNQSLNNIAYNNLPVSDNYINQPVNFNNINPNIGNNLNKSLIMVPKNRTTAGSYMPYGNIPLIHNNQNGIAIELKSDTSIKALNDYWTSLLAKFSGDDGKGLLTPYKDMVFFAVDEKGVGELGSKATTSRLYRLRLGPISDIETAQKLCDQMLKFSGTSCHIVRIQ